MSASGSSTRPPRGQAQQPQRQLIRPLRVVEQQRERLLVGQLDDQPPQRVHHLVGARARPARIRQRARRARARPSRAGPSVSMPRAARANSSRAPASGTPASISSAVACSTRAPPPRARPRATSSRRVLPIPASPSTSIAPPRPAAAADDFAEHRELASRARSARPRAHCLPPPTRAGNPAAARYRVGTGLSTVATPPRRTMLDAIHRKELDDRPHRRERRLPPPTSTPNTSPATAPGSPASPASAAATTCSSRDRTRAVADHVGERRRARRRRARAERRQRARRRSHHPQTARRFAS